MDVSPEKACSPGNTCKFPSEMGNRVHEVKFTVFTLKPSPRTATDGCRCPVSSCSRCKNDDSFEASTKKSTLEWRHQGQNRCLFTLSACRSCFSNTRKHSCNDSETKNTGLSIYTTISHTSTICFEQFWP